MSLTKIVSAHLLSSISGGCMSCCDEAYLDAILNPVAGYAIKKKVLSDELDFILIASGASAEEIDSLNFCYTW